MEPRWSSSSTPRSALALTVAAAAALGGCAAGDHAARLPLSRLAAVASGDGEDRAAAIQAALDAAGAAGGGVVELGPGTFPLRRALRVPSRVTLRGAGSGRTTLLLVELGSRLRDNPPECPPSTPRPMIPSVALYNDAHVHFRMRRPFRPASRTCGDYTVEDPAPFDRDIALAGFTLDCNSRALWPKGPQSAGNENLGCASLDHIVGLGLDDVTIRDANVDGLLLGVVDGVLDFHIRDSRIEGSGRYGIGWIAAARGVIERTALVENLAGGIDLEPIAAFGPEGAAHDVTLRDLHITGAAANPALAPRVAVAGRDSGVILCFPKGMVTRGIHLERVTIEDVAGLAVTLTWGGDYRDIDLDLDVHRAGIGGVYSSLPGHGTARVRGRMEEVGFGAGILGAAVGLFGEERGWTVGPLAVRQGPRWGGSSAVVVGEHGRDHQIRDITLDVTCEGRTAGGCSQSQLASDPKGGPLPPSNQLRGGALRFSPPAATLSPTHKQD